MANAPMKRNPKVHGRATRNLARSDARPRPKDATLVIVQATGQHWVHRWQNERCDWTLDVVPVIRAVTLDPAQPRVARVVFIRGVDLMEYDAKEAVGL
jgi:hypothetical protein